MAITSDGTQSFGIEASPVTINSVTYVVEGLSINHTGSRADLDDSNGEPLGSTLKPGRREISGTLQLAANTTASNVRGKEMVLSVTDSDINGTYIISDCSATYSQGEYVKIAINGWQKIN